MRGFPYSCSMRDSFCDPALVAISASRRRCVCTATRASDLAALGELPDVVGRAERERLNGHGRLASAGGDEARAVAQEQIRHVVGAVILVDDGARGIVAHPARAEQVHTAPRYALFRP